MGYMMSTVQYLELHQKIHGGQRVHHKKCFHYFGGEFLL